MVFIAVTFFFCFSEKPVEMADSTDADKSKKAELPDGK